MAARIIGIGMLVLILGVAAAFAVIAFIGPRDGARLADGGPNYASAAADREPFTVSREVGPWTLDAQVALDGTGGFELTLRIVDEGGEPATPPRSPAVLLSMLDHAMGTSLVPVEPQGPGSYRGAGSLSMEGRWRFRIELSGDETDMTVDFRR